jgi:GNAT superfamily N-acetyltransferase
MDTLVTRAEDVSNPRKVPALALVPLDPAHDRRALETHFSSLNHEDLRYRFCSSVKRAGVSQYLDQISVIGTPSYGVFNADLALIAVCQLEQSGCDLEVGLTVLPAFRREGFGKALLHCAARYARARGLKALNIHSLGNNIPMLSLARRIGMTVKIHSGEADGRLALCAGTEKWIDRSDVAFDQDTTVSSVTKSRDIATLRSN